MVIAALILAAQLTNELFDWNVIDPHRDALVVGDSAHIMLPPFFVQTGEVQDLAWSSDGRYLSILARPRDPDLGYWSAKVRQQANHSAAESLYVLDLAARKVQLVADRVSESAWLPGTDTLLALTYTSIREEGKPEIIDNALVCWRPGSDTKTLIHEAGAHTISQLKVSDKQPVGLLSTDRTQADGRMALTEFLITQEASLVPLKEPSLSAATFSSSGAPIVLRREAENGPGFYVAHEYQVDAQTGELTAVPGVFKPQETPSLPPPLLDAVVTTHRLTNARSSTSVQGAWLSPADNLSPRLIAAQADKPTLAPTFTGVAFMQSGALFVRKIVSMPAKDFAKLAHQFDRSAALMRARQVGHALVMFAADHDDRFPTAEEFGSITQYLGDPQMLEGFHYSLNGQNALQLADTTATVLGYIQLSDGQAVVYADTHCKLIPPITK